MEQVIKIDVPVGKEVKQTTDSNGNIVITYVDKEPVRSKSWKEFCENHPWADSEYYITSNSEIAFHYHDGKRNKFQSNTLATKSDAEGILALIQLTRLHDEWAVNYAPDWTDYECKYSIYNYRGEMGVYACTRQYHMLYFASEELAKEFFQCFYDLIMKAKKFI